VLQDKNPDNRAAAETKFKDISEAYEVCSSKKHRRESGNLFRHATLCSPCVSCNTDSVQSAFDGMHQSGKPSAAAALARHSASAAAPGHALRLLELAWACHGF
jgi:curved DNA-binding protein CbpA